MNLDRHRTLMVELASDSGAFLRPLFGHRGLVVESKADQTPVTWWIAAGPMLAAILFVLQLITPYLATVGTRTVRSPVLRSDIATQQSSGRSLMPEGMETVLKPQDVADLVSWLRAK